VAEFAERGLELAVEVGDDRLRGRCLALRGYAPFFVDFPAMHGIAADGERWGGIAGDPFAMDYGRLLRARSFTNRDRHAEAVRELGDLRARAEARGERSAAAFAVGVEVWAALFTGDVRMAAELGREALELAEPLGDYFTVGHMAFNLAWARGLAGDVDGAHAVIDPVIRAVTGASPQLFRWFALVPGRLHLWGGELSEAIRWLEIAATFTTEPSENWHVAQVLPALADALRRTGRADEAAAHADRALSMGSVLDIPHVRAAALDQQGFLAAGAGDPSRAASLHHDALAIRVSAGLRTFWVDSLDALAHDTDDPATAARLLAASDAGRAAIGYPRPLVDRAGNDDALAAVRTALDADTFAEAWAQGSALALDDAVAYATRSRGRRGRPATGWPSLSPTEQQVVGLVAAGLSNPDIGARLFMSRSTVKTHLAHVFAKLGVTSRAELAAVAGRQRADEPGPV
jgi:DNA-binding CsgD family transcriptional regulator/tetratricopeptide (TPR) repeat protein